MNLVSLLIQDKLSWTKLTVSTEEIEHSNNTKNSNNRSNNNYRRTLLFLEINHDFAIIVKFGENKGSLSSPVLKAELFLISWIPNTLEKQNYCPEVSEWKKCSSNFFLFWMISWFCPHTVLLVLLCSLAKRPQSLHNTGWNAESEILFQLWGKDKDFALLVLWPWN